MRNDHADTRIASFMKSSNPVFATRGDDLGTVAWSFVVLIGLYIDGWAHINTNRSETFFTSWHIILYGGLFGCIGWMLRICARNSRAGHVGIDMIPRAYGAGILGILIFSAAGLSDMIWHTVFGVEASIGALYSPPHLALLFGAFLIVTSPFRSAWCNPDWDLNPDSRAFDPIALSVVAALGMISFIEQHLWTLGSPFHSAFRFARVHDVGRAYLVLVSLSSILLVSITLTSLVLIVCTRWNPPLGTFAFILGLNTGMMVGMKAEGAWEQVAVAVIGGGVADLLVRRLQPACGTRPRAKRLIGAVFPLALWGTHFIAIGLVTSNPLQIEETVGITVTCSLAGLMLATMMTLPGPIPNEAATGGAPE